MPRRSGHGGRTQLTGSPKNPGRFTLHTFKNVGQTVAKMVDWSIPGGQDKYFLKVHELVADGSFTGEIANQVNAQFDTLFPS